MTEATTIEAARAAITVSELNRQARRLLEQGISTVWVEGEVSNLARPASGHIYFTLKDKSAQLRCAWFKQRQRGPALQVKNGDKLLALGKVSIYEARGDYQMIVERTETAGEGELRRRFELLKSKLLDEGLFDEARKISPPTLPERIGIITSPSGAAVHDILTVLQRRFPLVPVIIYPSAVQGAAAAFELVAALHTAATRNECDVLILSRGGGSLEDLWPFNEETVARAIATCPIPVISAVGHEVDFTIADFVADLRAATPSAAAELVVPDQDAWLRALAAMAGRIATLSRRRIENTAQTVDWLSKRLAQSSPGATVARQTIRLANLHRAMAAAMSLDLTRRSGHVERIRSRLLQRSPALQVQNRCARLATLKHRLTAAVRQHVQRNQAQLNVIARGLQAVSPKATLERGYAIVSDSKTGRVLTGTTNLQQGSNISARLATGSVSATVTEIHPDNDKQT